MSALVYVVEDEASIAEMISFSLSRQGMRVECFADAVTAHSKILEGKPDILLLDWMLPAVSGVEFAKRLRRDPFTRELPIIMLTARGEENDRVQGLDSGVDDYMQKPFSTRELLARIRALLRRSALGQDELLALGPVVVNLASHRVEVGGENLALGPTEFRLLKVFMSKPDRVLSRAQLIDEVWGGSSEVEERSVDVHVGRLRRALESKHAGQFLQTVRAAGYRFSLRVD
jgi:two-component system, OmpR family, phosphate regulon response regulator PhoB